jgi:excisionase family DNA binding protein
MRLAAAAKMIGSPKCSSNDWRFASAAGSVAAAALRMTNRVQSSRFSGEPRTSASQSGSRRCCAEISGMVVKAYEDARSALEPLWTLDLTATYLSVTKRQVYNLIDSGLVPAIRVGGVLRVDPVELRARLEEARL